VWRRLPACGRALWRPWMLSYGRVQPADLDDWTPREWEALVRDYKANANG